MQKILEPQSLHVKWHPKLRFELKTCAGDLLIKLGLGLGENS